MTQLVELVGNERAKLLMDTLGLKTIGELVEFSTRVVLALSIEMDKGGIVLFRYPDGSEAEFVMTVKRAASK